MTAFGTLFAVAFEQLIDLFGEPIVYKPRNGTPRTIDAIVDRNPPATDETSLVQLPRFEIQVRNHATTGILSTAIDCGGDKIELPEREDETTTKLYGVQAVLSDDGKVMHLEVY